MHFSLYADTQTLMLSVSILAYWQMVSCLSGARVFSEAHCELIRNRENGRRVRKSCEEVGEVGKVGK